MASSQPTAWPQSGRIVFVSLGLAILDELHLSDGTAMRDVPGGSGLYSRGFRFPLIRAHMWGFGELLLLKRVNRYCWRMHLNEGSTK